MMVDPSVLSSLFPHKRQLHYWAKSTLFSNPIAGYILRSAGNIPVDRTTKDNAILFKGTFEALARGEAIAVFPEGKQPSF
jgi:1-acyl-sn-glycerol-3-phosphate acyltransferase